LAAGFFVIVKSTCAGRQSFGDREYPCMPRPYGGTFALPVDYRLKLIDIVRLLERPSI
jgi:hypothetical protein